MPNPRPTNLWRNLRPYLRPTKLIALILALSGTLATAGGILGLIAITRNYNGIHNAMLHLYTRLLIIGRAALVAAAALWWLPKTPRRRPR